MDKYLKSQRDDSKLYGHTIGFMRKLAIWLPPFQYIALKQSAEDVCLFQLGHIIVFLL